MPINPQYIQIFNGMAQLFYKITFNMVLIIKLMWKIKPGWKHTKVEYFLTYVESLLMLK
jgi:hypothetical protein